MLNKSIFTIKQVQKRFTSIFFLTGFIALLVGLLFQSLIIFSFASVAFISTFIVFLRYNKYLKHLNNLEDGTFSVLIIEDPKALFVKYGDFTAPTNCILLYKDKEYSISIRLGNSKKLTTTFTPSNNLYTVDFTNDVITFIES